ncbi:unnamed protein product [Chironomus riparius]|uniref:PHD-type domain-containing protein n=1 Tax=Chironomus riparius TaxID=315576 RepID=A0A9N9WP05_9DIPT|nr:unnamed protein product [Chironomus riparius]
MGKTCQICEFPINKGEKEIIKCQKCNTCIHTICERDNDVLHTDGKFYCKNHDKKRRKNAQLTEPPLPVAPSNTFPKPTTYTDNKKSKKSDKVNRKENLNHEQVLQLSQQIISLLESSVVSIPPGQSTSNDIGDEQEEESESEDGDNDDGLNEDEIGNNGRKEMQPPQNTIKKSAKRMPNRPGSNNPPGCLSKSCAQCSKRIEGAFFFCYCCRVYCHDECINGDDRMNHIEGSWCCGKCLIKWAQHVSLFNYDGEDQEVLKEKSALQADTYANMRIDDNYFEPRRISIFPGNARTSAQEPRAQIESNSNKYSTDQCNAPKNVNEGNTQNIVEMFKAFQEQQNQMMQTMFSNFALLLSQNNQQSNLNQNYKQPSRSENESFEPNTSNKNVRANIRKSEINRLARSESTAHDLDEILDEEAEIGRRRSDHGFKNEVNNNDSALIILAENQIAENKNFCLSGVSRKKRRNLISQITVTRDLNRKNQQSTSIRWTEKIGGILAILKRLQKPEGQLSTVSKKGHTNNYNKIDILNKLVLAKNIVSKLNSEDKEVINVNKI